MQIQINSRFGVFMLCIETDCLSLIVALVFDVAITTEVASAFTTIFSIIFTILFGFATILVGRISSTNVIEKQIVSETFVSIISASLLALIADNMFDSIHINKK